MKLKHWIWLWLILIATFILCYAIWGAITYAEWKEIVQTKDYIEKLEIQEQQMKALWEEENAKCNENLDYYHTQAIYLRATIEEETAKLEAKLGLHERR